MPALHKLTVLLVLGCGSLVSAGEFSRPADKRFVRFSHGTFVVNFDTLFGAAPLDVTYQGRRIIEKHAGEGFQFTWETGQDATQAGANGVDPHPVAKLIDSATLAAIYSYYTREVELTVSRYTVRGFFPAFWISHEPADDFIPVAVPAQTGWRTRYSPGTRPATDFYQFGTPIWFESSAARPSGIFMVGNETTARTIDPMLRIREGRVAFKTRVQLKDASADAFAGVVYRKSLAGGPTTTMDQIYAAPGYMLLVNKAGVIQLHKSGKVLWDGGVNQLVKNTVNVNGTLIEVRTHNLFPSQQEIWVENKLVKVINATSDPTPVLGPYIGMIASCATGRVRFSDRQIFDVSIETESTYSARADGGLQSLLTVKNAPFVTSPMTLYRVNHVAFLDHSTSNDLRAVRSDDGVPLAETGAYLPRLFDTAAKPFTLYAGRKDRIQGLACLPIRATVNGVHSPTSHALISTPPAILHLNALGLNANTTPTSATEVKLEAAWFPYDRK